jgi:hypothetical protein
MAPAGASSGTSTQLIHGKSMARAILQRFQATIHQHEVNPYVEIPPRISRALAAHARSGRIRVDGFLGRTSIRGTLVPVRNASGRAHRLYINGGIRTAAGVGVGDRVALAIRAVGPDQVSVPADLRTALRRDSDVRAAFDALSASHLRELVRFIDDARTPIARRRRIQETIEHVRGGPVRPGRRPRPTSPRRPTWSCPKCGNAFVTRNQWHSCARHSLEEPFAGKSPAVRELFDRFRAMVEACGPVKLVPYRDRIGFMVRVRFAGATPRSDALDVGFWLTRRIASPRFRRVETIGPRVHLHSVRLNEATQLDDELAAWIREAYKIGRQEHL